MNIVKWKTLRDYANRNPDARHSLEAWHKIARTADWKMPDDVRRDIPQSSIVGNNRVVFDICGNRYRLVAHIRYDKGRVFVRFIGTHQEYDRVDAASI